jgi:hypothetical protein
MLRRNQAGAPFAQGNSLILLDTHVPGEQDRPGVSPFEARRSLKSACSFLKDKLRIER